VSVYAKSVYLWLIGQRARDSLTTRAMIAALCDTVGVGLSHKKTHLKNTTAARLNRMAPATAS